MATMNTSVLLAVTCRSTSIQWGRIVAFTWRQWLRERDTLLRLSCSTRAVQNNLGLVVYKNFVGIWLTKMYVWPDGGIMSQNTHVTTLPFNK